MPTGYLILDSRVIRSVRSTSSVARNDFIVLLIYYAISVLLLYVAANVEYLEIVKLSGAIRGLIG